VSAKKDESIQIVLVGNPTTGYTWQVENVAPLAVAVNGAPQFVLAGAALGGSGKFTINLTAIARGQTNLRLVYLRASERDTPTVARRALRLAGPRLQPLRILVTLVHGERSPTDAGIQGGGFGAVGAEGPA
jgi:predicted secreted protein